MCAYCLVGWYITSSERYAAAWPTTGLLAQRLGPQLSRVVGESGGSCYGNGVFRRSVFAGAFLAVRFTGGFCARNAGTRSCCGLRSEERRVGKGGGSTGRSRGSP